MGTRDTGGTDHVNREADHVHGEGNYEASRQYNRATKRFVESGKVEQAARDAQPRTPEEAREMREAEAAALLRAKHAPDGSVDDEMSDDDGTSPR